MNQLQPNPEKGMYAVLELFDEREIDVVFAPDTVTLLKRDIQQVLDEVGISLAEIYEIEVVRPFE